MGEQVAGLGAEGALAAHAAEGAGQPAALAALDQHQHDQEQGRQQQHDHQQITQKRMHEHPSFDHKGPGDDAQELVDLQARAADQGAVDIGLLEQFGGVVGLDAAAVLDPHRRRQSSYYSVRP